jgi:hypothetical protein
MHTRTRTRARAPTFATRFAILIPFPVITDFLNQHCSTFGPNFNFSASEEADQEAYQVSDLLLEGNESHL